MAEYINQRLRGTILLDGNTFRGCDFSDCEVIYSGGQPPVMTQNQFQNAKFSFQGPAANTVRFLMAMARPTSGLQKLIRNTFRVLSLH